MSENLSNKTCGECKYYEYPAGQCAKVVEYNLCHIADNACEYFEQKVITNGDKIRQMSNEEFAKSRIYHCPPVPAEFCKGTDTFKCVKCWLNYLNAPAESEGKDE